MIIGTGKRDISSRLTFTVVPFRFQHSVVQLIVRTGARPGSGFDDSLVNRSFKLRPVKKLISK